MSEFDHDHSDQAPDDGTGVSRRRVLECMTWAGTGVLWTISGGVPRSLGLVGAAQAAQPAGLTFLQISDSHVGFDKPANPNAIGTLEEAIAKINGMPAKPSFMIHTGDITHLSKAAEFDNAETIISREAPIPPKAVPMSRPASAVKKRASAKKPTSTITSAIAAEGRCTVMSGTTAAASSIAPKTM